MKRKGNKLPSGRWLLLLGSGLLLVWSLLPLTDGVEGVGVFAPAAVAALGIGWAVFAPGKKARKGWQKAMATGLWIAVCVVAVAGTVFSGLMLTSAAKKPAEGATVIVLGSKINGDRPSRMLRARLDAAADYLQANPTANCVVSGGLGEGEAYTEAQVMKAYLVKDRGIAPERIACEDASTDTHENLHFSMALIREKGWNANVAVATQAFHQYRAGVKAQAAGADSVGAVVCFSPPHLMLNYWVRECAAICRLWLLRY